MHKPFILIRSHSIHCIGASNITILVNIVDQTLAAKADMFQEDSYQIEIDSDDHL